MNRFRFFLRLLLDNAPSYLGGVVMLGLTLGMTLSIPRYLQEAVDLLSTPAEPGGPTFLGRITWIFVFAVAIIFTRTGSRLFFFIPGRRVEFDLKNRLLAHLSTLQRAYFQQNPTGTIISRINNDINGIRMTMGFGIMQFVGTIATLSLAPYFMYLTSPRLTLYCALPIVAAFAVLQLAMRRLRREQLVQMKALQDLSDFTVESYNGIDVLKTYRAYSWSEERFGGLSGEVRDSGIRLSNVRALFFPILSHLVNALKVMLMLVGGLMVIRSEMTMGAFMAFALYLTMMLPPLMGMTFMMFVLQRGFTALASLESVLNTDPGLPPVVPEAEEALPAVLRQGLRVEGLTYAYPDEPERPVLRDVSLEVRPGEIVGIFGPVGSGKTTLVNAINRYVNPPAGAIRLDGIDATELSLARLREAVVTVTQDAFLFSTSIRENIEFASATEGERPDLEQTVEAAALSADLSRFPEGLDTQVGEKGITLSGGQKQRIALARAMMKPCELLILDDPLSAVDHDTERFLIDRIYGFQHSRALLIVSHRVSVLERADRIVVLEAGRVAQMGSHAELTAAEGNYRTAWLLQTDRGEVPLAPGGEPARPA
ncbi:MAG: ABC transporter ATP-binding protein [SAR324 cluster bacterium]|nr:ABC transporter ATP-binding protein [SAR324 cluster bacterium]